MARDAVKTALVTGGARGIGRATAELLASRGYSVAIADIDRETGREAEDGGLWFVGCDVASEASVEACVRTLQARYGRLDALVNNAALSGAAGPPVERLTLEEWNRRIAANLTSVFLIAKHCAAAPRRPRATPGRPRRRAARRGRDGRVPALSGRGLRHRPELRARRRHDAQDDLRGVAGRSRARSPLRRGTMPSMAKSGIRIRLAQAHDAQAIALMSRDLIEAGLGWKYDAARVLRATRNRDTTVLVAEVHAAVAGFAIMEFGDERAHLVLLAVRPAQRRAGIGRRLLEWLIESAHTAGMESVHLELRAGNEAAHAFYRAMGFCETITVPGYYRGREAALRMLRMLRVPGPPTYSWRPPTLGQK